MFSTVSQRLRNVDDPYEIGFWWGRGLNRQDKINNEGHQLDRIQDRNEENPFETNRQLLNKSHIIKKALKITWWTLIIHQEKKQSNWFFITPIKIFKYELKIEALLAPEMPAGAQNWSNLKKY